MIEISYLQMVLAISVIWITVRAICSVKAKCFDWKRELQLLLVYICLIVVATLPILVAFPFFLNTIEKGAITGGVKE